MRLKDCKTKWFKFEDLNGILVRWYKDIQYKKINYRIFLYKFDTKISIQAFFKKINGRRYVLIDCRAFKIATKEELNALIKHEILHDVLKHKNIAGTKKYYVEKHKEIFLNMTKKELVNHATLHYKVIL